MEINFKGIGFDGECKYHLYLTCVGDQRIETTLVLNCQKFCEVIQYLDKFVTIQECFFVLKYRNEEAPVRMFVKNRTKPLIQFYMVLYLHTWTMLSGTFYTRSKLRKKHLVEARKLLVEQDTMFVDVPDGEILTAIAQENNNWGFER